MYNHDPEGSRNNFVEHSLGPETVGDLQVKWTYETGPVAGTPAVVNDRVYAADAAGVVYALDRDGKLLWQTTLDVGPTLTSVKVTDSPLVTNRTVVIGDSSGQVHGLDVHTGAVKWTVRPPSPTPTGYQNPYATIYGSPTMVGHYVAIGMSSEEEIVAGNPAYIPTFRGSLVLLDPDDGAIVWQTFTISDQESAAGASGAAIWSTPTYDQATNTIYATTGNNYSEPATGTSDAFIAFDATSGAIRWVSQRTHHDTWNYSFGDSSDHLDFDFGDSPQVYRLGGRMAVSAGQKSGFFHVLDAATGEEVSAPIQLTPGGTLGGLFADSAYANGVVYANGSDWPGVLLGEPPRRGILSAVAADGSHELWHFDTAFSPDLSGVAVANGVVYFQSTFDGTLYALDAVTGTLLKQVTTGGVTSGPAISRGQIYVGIGDATVHDDPTGPLGHGAIVALGLPDDHARVSESPNGGSKVEALSTERAHPHAGDAVALGQAGTDVSAIASALIGVATPMSHLQSDGHEAGGVTAKTRKAFWRPTVRTMAGVVRAPLAVSLGTNRRDAAGALSALLPPDLDAVWIGRKLFGRRPKR
jgi:polyvinyl alcohol dehydrogenase (cytochrome)